MLERLTKLTNGNNSVKEFRESIHQGAPSVVFGVSGAFKNFLVGALDIPVLLIVKDSITARTAVREIKEFSNKTAVYIPPKDDGLIVSKASSKDGVFERITALYNAKNADVIVATPETVMGILPLKINSLEVNKNDELDLFSAINTLVLFGYKRVENVESKGAFSVRGDILDVFPINAENPIRIDFFGDTIEIIKEFDLESRKTVRAIKSAVILPAVEFVYSEQDISEFRNILSVERKTCEKTAKSRINVLADDLTLAIENKDVDALGVFAPTTKRAGSIFDIIKKDSAIIFDEAKLVYETATLFEREFTERFKSLKVAGEVFSFMEKNLLPVQYLIDKIVNYKKGTVQTLSTAIPFFNPQKIINPNVSGVSNYQLDFKEVYNDINNWLYSGYSVLVCAESEKKAEQFCFDLSTHGIASALNTDKIQGVVVSAEKLSRGFVFHEEKIVVIGSGNLFIKPPSARPAKKRHQAFFSAPETGDYCVHETHGIGRVLGNRKIMTTEGTKDYISVEYSGGDILSIPVEQLDVLSRYLGGEKHPRLSKIGGKDFERIKKAVKESIKKMSFDIKKLYAERNALKGFACEKDDYLQSAFNDAFSFEETADQLSADFDIKEDMLSGKVMDRLICGDVGFGKTEVAFRAVFRMVANGKQVAMLAPTTILTEQHFNTAKERFKDFGVRIACLNRFKTAKEQAVIIDKLKNGEIDFVIGTHRLLSKDVGFHDLGLLVLDEEQRFGVEHKEKIKLLKKNVDTLTLTATPIPRTLHMSLSGMRDISTINTPPKKRLPVQTYVVEQTDAVIKDAINRELNRKGQTFILYNRVESIYKFADYVKSLFTDLKITVAHGQMDEKTLEKNIMSFYSGQTDVLISTTIIENGIDLPKANTIIVIDADMLGLSTLYQLKGRVGRSDRLAYAYFTFRREKILSATAFERLNAITDFTEMGSGIKIAMRDLEIRGAGNILGAEQHGHMDKIGYELYAKLLREELSGKEEIVPELDIRVSAFIPDSYIESSSSRMDSYKEIAELSSAKAEKEFVEYTTETYGSMPKEMENLINISVVKRLAMRLGVSEITIKKDRAFLAFTSFKAFDNASLLNAIDNTIGVRISMAEKPCIDFDNFAICNEKTLELMRAFLIDATK